MADYSVLLPGAPQTAAQAANDAFPGSTSQTVLPQVTVTGTYSDAIAPPIPNLDLNPIQVTAQKMGLPATSSIMDWLKPPKLFLTIGIGAGIAFLILNRKKKRGRR